MHPQAGELARQELAITAAALAEEAEHGGLSDNEKALAKGMLRKSWTGPPLLENIGGGSVTQQLGTGSAYTDVTHTGKW
jgi:hypothetical protein